MLKWIGVFATVAVGTSECFPPVTKMIKASPCLITCGEILILGDFASASAGDITKRSAAMTVVITKKLGVPGFNLSPSPGKTAFLSPEFLAL